MPVSTGSSLDDGVSRWDVEPRGRSVVVCRYVCLLMVITFTLAHALGVSAALDSEPTTGKIHLLKIDGVINPLSARYVAREVGAAEAQQARLIVLQLNTPGGLETSMREISQSILTASVPIAVYVTPSGARAASAGMFIVLSAHVAAMAPDTTIGAAHPVQLGEGQREKGDNEGSPMADKLVNDAASFARALAHRAGRNATWAEEAVRESVSITAEEALQQRVIDIISPSVDDLLSALEGRRVKVAEHDEVVLSALRTPGLLVERPMNVAERVLHIITDPNLAYILMSIGILGITLELYSPGSLFPGVTGVIALLLAFISLGSLPVSWAGVVLISVAVVFFLLELLVQGFGLLGIGGIIAFILGSLFLYRPVNPVSPVLPSVSVDPLLIGLAAAVLLLCGALVIRLVVRSQRRVVTSGPQALVGAIGHVESTLAPHGFVRIDSEVWSARVDPKAQDVQVEKGAQVEVTDVRGVTVIVRTLPTHRAFESRAG